jgi:hypothetical protein
VNDAQFREFMNLFGCLVGAVIVGVLLLFLAVVKLAENFCQFGKWFQERFGNEGDDDNAGHR